MPYIKDEEKKKFEFILNYLDEFIKDDKAFDSIGNVNFLITMICDKYVKAHGEKYKHYNDVIGVLECAKLEYYRRRAIPYEDKKIEENGDVYA